VSYSCLSFVDELEGSRDDSNIQDDQFIHILRRTDVCVKMYCQLPAAAQQAACASRGFDCLALSQQQNIPRHNNDLACRKTESQQKN